MLKISSISSNINSKRKNAVAFEAVNVSKPVIADETDTILKMTKLTNSLEKTYLKSFPDIFGKGFTDNFLNPWNDFLVKHGVKIVYSKDPIYIPPNEFVKEGRRLENGVAADLVSTKYNRSIIFNTNEWYGINEPIKGITQNDATVKLLYNLIHDKMEMMDSTFEALASPLEGVKFPDKLRQTTDDVYMVLTGLKTGLQCNMDNSNDKGGLFFKKVLIRLMPENLPNILSTKSPHLNTIV